MPDRKVAAVTGASSGIDLHTAVALAARGPRVAAIMREIPDFGDCFGINRWWDDPRRGIR